MIAIDAGDFKQTFVEHYYTERAKRDTGSHLYFIHVVDFEVAGLFDPVLNEGIAQGMLGFRFRKIGPADDETIFAHVLRSTHFEVKVNSITVVLNNPSK